MLPLTQFFIAQGLVITDTCTRHSTYIVVSNSQDTLHILHNAMANLNKVFLMGNLTADPEVRYTPKGTAVCDLRLAINRYIGSGTDSSERQEETTFVDITLWSRQAEIAGTYLKKGRGVFIEGRLQLDSWEDKQTGQKRTKLRVIGENMQLMPRGGENPQNNRNYNSGNQQFSSGYGKPTPPPASTPQQQSPMDDFPEDDDIPF